MIKKTVKYEDFDGNQREEDFYFNLSKAELAVLENSVGGGLHATVDKILKADNKPELIKYFKKIVLMSYGKKSDDGRNFIKNDKIREDFESCAAYSEIFMELASDDKAAAAFVNGILPKDIQDHNPPQNVTPIVNKA